MTWNDFFDEEKNKEYFSKMISFMGRKYKEEVVYPKKEDVFNSFKLTSFENLKVVIVGQDPYINENEAMGLAFSVRDGIKLPPSLKNIYKEIELEFNRDMNFNSGDLTYLATQGVFLINPILTVKKGVSLSHDITEYKIFFKNLFDFIDTNIDHPIVIMLWGNKAKKYKDYIKNENILILEASHPSPLSANQGGWFHSNIFIKCNEYLTSNNLVEINWINTSIFD